VKFCAVFFQRRPYLARDRGDRSSYGYIVLGHIHRVVRAGDRIGQGLRRLGAQIGAKEMNFAYLLSGLLALALLIYLLAALIWAEDL
jgi:K+-transporting ATPase KdpF subunit